MSSNAWRSLPYVSRSVGVVHFYNTRDVLPACPAGVTFLRTLSDGYGLSPRAQRRHLGLPLPGTVPDGRSSSTRSE